MGKKKVKLGMPLLSRPFLIECPVAASQAFKRRSGHFVKLDSNRRAEIADSGDSEIIGWALVGADWTSSSTAGADKITVDTHPLHVWEIPADATFTAANLAALIGKTCDLIVDGNGIQKADIGESNEDVIVIIGGDVDEQTLYVHLNPNKLYATGVV
ncbi:MAG: hypothetical protein DRJ60_02320 [Thermoprotei archaeon]|nr:MAG: hypothetical protein DRJ60_02320 [Thermoprotei archaeon]